MRHLLILTLAVACVLANEPRRAVVVLKGKDNVQGHLTFTETPEGIKIEGQITGLEPGKHGFHVHAKGDLSNGCDSMGGHFNPHNKSHGAPEAPERHVGDLGNVEANSAGVADIHILDNLISLGGEHCILGRGLVVHSKEDDLGLGGKPDSLTTGSAGSRVACGVIGILSPEVWPLRQGANSASSVTYSLLISGLASMLLALY